MTSTIRSAERERGKCELVGAIDWSDCNWEAQAHYKLAGLEQTRLPHRIVGMKR
jgi:hypothetical protein